MYGQYRTSNRRNQHEHSKTLHKCQKGESAESQDSDGKKRNIGQDTVKLKRKAQSYKVLEGYDKNYAQLHRRWNRALTEGK